jgi:type IV secretory pathway TrbD component
MKPTYRSLNKRMVLLGCDRRLFLSGLFVGVSMLMLFGSFTFGLIVFGIFATAGWFQARDPVLLRLMLRFGQQVQFDPAKFESFPVVFHGRTR